MDKRRNASHHVVAALVAAMYLTCPFPAAAQDRVDPMAATVAQWFTMIERSFVALAEAMPADKFAFKPTSGEFTDARTFGEQVKHVACANFGFFNEIEQKEPPAGCGTGGPHPATTKAEINAYLRDSFDYAGRVLRQMTPDNALEPAGGPYGGKSTRLGLTTLAVWHASDHYGQLVVYLRMNGIVPPASRPEPADPAGRPAATVFKDGAAYGTVTRIELPFGNLDTTFVASDLRSLGISPKETIQVRCGGKVVDVFFGRAFADVPRGEWVAFVSPEGTLKIARNFASAAEASGCKATDTVVLSKRRR